MKSLEETCKNQTKQEMRRRKGNEKKSWHALIWVREGVLELTQQDCLTICYKNKTKLSSPPTL